VTGTGQRGNPDFKKDLLICVEGLIRLHLSYYLFWMRLFEKAVD
jgi:hypothetical protein